jgi:hypothetical protein
VFLAFKSSIERIPANIHRQAVPSTLGVGAVTMSPSKPFIDRSALA